MHKQPTHQDLNLVTSDQHVSMLQKQIRDFEHTLAEKNIYLAKLELDLEHAINQCKKIAAQRMQALSSNPNQWINRQEPGLEHK